MKKEKGRQHVPGLPQPLTLLTQLISEQLRTNKF